MSSYWKAIHGSRDVVQEVPLERWEVEGGFNPATAPQGMSIYVRFGAFCDGVACFDQDLFKFSANECTATDPQHRLLLEETATAWADASGGTADISGNLTGRAREKHLGRLLFALLATY